MAMCDSRATRPSGPRLESSERASESSIVEIDQKLFFCIPGHWHWDLRMIKIKKKKKEQRDEEPSCWLYHPTIINIIKYTVPLTSQLHSLPNLVIPEALRPMTCLWKRNSFSMSHLSRENRRFRCRPWAENPDFRIENDRIHGNFTAMFHHGTACSRTTCLNMGPQFPRMNFSKWCPLALGKNRWVGLLNFTMYHHPPHLESKKTLTPLLIIRWFGSSHLITPCLLSIWRQRAISWLPGTKLASAHENPPEVPKTVS